MFWSSRDPDQALLMLKVPYEGNLFLFFVFSLLLVHHLQGGGGMPYVQFVMVQFRKVNKGKQKNTLPHSLSHLIMLEWLAMGPEHKYRPHRSRALVSQLQMWCVKSIQYIVISGSFISRNKQQQIFKEDSIAGLVICVFLLFVDVSF